MSASPNKPPLPSEGPSSLEDNRIRFLRACDRCRTRKIKCGQENPCAKCLAAGVICSFTLPGSSRTVLSTAESRQGSDVYDSSHLPPQSSVKRRRAEPEDVESRRRKVLDHDETAHFFLSGDGLSHHAGSTSGLPLLEATRRLADAGGADPDQHDAEPDWQWLHNLLNNDGSINSRGFSERQEEAEYFPGRDVATSRSNDDIFSLITQTIPADLMSSLVHIFFKVIHPVWPILHIPSFFIDLYRWEDHSFAALVVSMCMLASRYTDDPRVCTDPDNPASAGVGYYEVFKRLRDQAINADNVVHAVQSLFFAGLFNCVDNTPHPIAQGLFAEALARAVDGGLHRPVSSDVLGHSILREMRSRTVWALYVWDKQIAAFCGRPHFHYLWDIDVCLPEPFEEVDSTCDEWPVDEDSTYVTTFRELILVSAVLENAFSASSHRPIVDNSDFLNELSRHSRPDLDDGESLAWTLSALEKWRRSAPPLVTERQAKERALLPGYSVASEQVASVDQTIKLVVASRHLQLETLATDPDRTKIEQHRAAVINAARDLVALVVQLGSARLLGSCDILIAYRLLLAGRLLLACVLSAKTDNNQVQTEEATKILQASSVLLRHFVSLFPVALGAAEVLDETIRVCRVSLPQQTASRSLPPNRNRFAWYRPVTLRKNIPAAENEEPSQELNRATGSGPVLSEAAKDLTLSAPLPISDLSPVDMAFSLGNMPVSLFNTDATHHGDASQDADFSWLLPGGAVPYYFPST